MQNFSAILLNLDRDTMRLAHMQEQLTRAGISYTRQSGVVGDALEDNLKPYFFTADGRAKTTMRRGEIGCYASHLRALIRVAAGEFGDVVLIMEDDLTLAPDCLNILITARAALPVGWDILRLSNPSRRAYVPIAKIGFGLFLIRYSKIPTSAGAYMITRIGAKKFLKNGVRGLTFDDDLRRPWFHHMDTYGILPPPMLAGAMQQSTIDLVESGRFDKNISSRLERIIRGDHFYMFRRLAYNVQTLGAGNWLLCQLINIIDMAVKPALRQSIIHKAARFFPNIHQQN